MRGPHSFGSRLLAGGGLGVLAVMFGCAQVFGFQSPGTVCHLNSDCPGLDVCSFGACTPQCNGPKDCLAGETCSEGVCRLTSDAGVTGEIESGADVELDVEAAPACGDVTVDPNNCGACGTQCTLGPCEESACRVIVNDGPYQRTASPSVHTFDVNPMAGDSGFGVIAGVEIDIPNPGWVVQLSTLTAEGGAQMYLGLYTDDGGRPDKLVVATDEFTTNGDPNGSDIPTLTTVAVHATKVPASHYWILGTWESEIAFEIPSGSLSCDNGACEYWYYLNYQFGPPPNSVPEKQSLLTDPIPILYAGVAE
jgi:hypothetical protein